MLTTPIGDLIIKKNGMEIDYRIIPQSLTVIEACNYIVDARYLILIDTTIIVPGDVIKCYIDCENIKTGGNGGEYLTLLDFYADDLLLSIGGYEILYHEDSSNRYAFEIYCIDNGLEAEFINLERVEEFRLAICWMKLNEGRDETAVWYGADPLLCSE